MNADQDSSHPWNAEKQLHDPETGYVVRISSRVLPESFTDGLPKKHYSFEFGILYDLYGNVRFSRFFRIPVFSENGVPKMATEFDVQTLIRLIYEARQWVLDQEKERQAEITRRRGRTG